MAEFFWADGGDRSLIDATWHELLEFMGHTKATVLVVMRPREIAADSATYLGHSDALRAAEVRLVFAEKTGLGGVVGEGDATARAA